jgi:hypothetical protein
MKTVSLHSGVHHCPECYIEYELSDEASLKCEACNGLLAEGSLDDLDNEEDQDDLGG